MMKAWMMLAALCAATAAVAAEIAVSPMKINFLKEASFDDQIVSGISVPGGSLDFPLNGKFDASSFNCAALTLEAVDGGVMPEASDMYLNLRPATKGAAQIHVVGAAGRKAGEFYFYFTGAPADVSMMRLYLDANKRLDGKKFAFKVKSMKFDKYGKEMFFAYVRAHVNNCENPISSGTLFGGKALNGGCAVLFFPQPKETVVRNFKFSKVEIGYTPVKEKLSDESVEFNPRHADNTGAEVRDPDFADGKFTFMLDEPFSNTERIFFYFNRAETLKGKEVQFKINYICLIE